MSKTIFTGPIIFTNAKENPILNSGAVLIDDGEILAVGKLSEIQRINPDATVENLGDGLLTPGLVNLHHHLYSSLARGWNPSGNPPENFPEVLERIWWKLDKALQMEDIHYSAIVGLGESIRSGVTAVIDHHASYGTITGSLDAIAEAYQIVGQKGSICFELSDRAGFNAFDSGLNETINAFKKWPGISKNNRLSAMIGLHASMTLSDDSLGKIADTFKDHDAGYHFHLAEDKSDQDNCRAKYKMRITERFAEYGILGDRSLAVHGVHLDETEVKLLAGSATNLAICARSNQNNAVGFPEWWKYAGVNIGLGTDGIGSDIISEAKSTLYASRHVRKSPNFGFGEIGELLLESNPEIFGKITGHRVGRLATGYPADMVLWRYNSPTPISSENIWGHYLYGLYNHQADSVWVNGENVLSEGQFSRFDYNETLVKARILAQKLWERI
ncbi:MAG: amidohydrolase family protein [candidate division Zixibacteria bacterium]|nr:amidohydrolase family protein [candidate division Zixibacteria bacterium]